MGAKSQRKGARGESELVEILRKRGYDVQRGGSLTFGRVPDLIGLPGVHIECKRAETLRLSEWLAQAETDAKRFGDGAPAVFFRRSRSPWYVTMKLEDWLTIYQAATRQKTAKIGVKCYNKVVTGVANDV